MDFRTYFYRSSVQTCFTLRDQDLLDQMAVKRIFTGSVVDVSSQTI